MRTLGQRKVVADEQASYEELYRTHHARVMQLCRLLLTDLQEAEEVRQEVFLKLFRECQRQHDAMAWGPWLTRVTVNACRDRRRSGWWRWWRENGEEFSETDFPDDSLTPEQVLLSRERRERLWQAYRCLSVRQQEVFVLRHLEGWETEAVAQTLGLTAGSVKQHLFRAVRSLRSALGEDI